MKLDQLLGAVTPQAYENLKYAVETGRWLNGQLVTAEQRDHCLQAIIAYDLKHLEERERVGFIDRGRKGQPPRNEWQPLRIDASKPDA